MMKAAQVCTYARTMIETDSLILLTLQYLTYCDEHYPSALLRGLIRCITVPSVTFGARRTKSKH
jgi:hypothetical protein